MQRRVFNAFTVATVPGKDSVERFRGREECCACSPSRSEPLAGYRIIYPFFQARVGAEMFPSAGSKVFNLSKSAAANTGPQVLRRRTVRETFNLTE